MAEIVNTGRNKIALQQGNSLPLNIAKFVFANIPGLDPASPVNLAQGLPAAQHIVFEKPKTAQGYVADDQVVYSVILAPTDGDFTFNWVGLVDADNVLIAVSYTPLQYKYKTVGLEVGNTLTRNFLLQFKNATSLTGITVSAEAWQIDFIGRLDDVEESLRANMRDVFGDSRFIGNGFQTYIENNTVVVVRGVGYVGGYRVELASEAYVNAGVLPKDIYLDCALQGDVSQSNVTKAFRASPPNAPLFDYVDGQGRKHYVVKIAAISAASVVTDLRKTISANSSVLEHVLALISALANVARTGSAADLIGTLNAARLPFSYGTAATANHLVQRDAAGNVLVPTAPANDNSSKAASTAHVANAINNLVGAAPGALNALDELASALGNNPNFATDILNALAGKAPLHSPALTGTPTAPTAPQGTNTTQLATTAFMVAAINALATVARTGNAADLIGTLNAARLPFSYGTGATANLVAQRDASGHLYVPNLPLSDVSTKSANTNFVASFVADAINALVASAPGALNTLQELATALGNNPNFATDIVNMIAARAPLNSPALTGVPTAPTAAAGTNSTQIATTEFAQALAAGLMGKNATTTLVHVGSATSVSLSGNGFFIVLTNAPSGPNSWMGNAALVFKGPASSTQTVFAVNNEYTYIASLSGFTLRAFSVNRNTNAESAISINTVYKIG
jgi:hypothetical protein